jgi:hypothetical protein
LRTQSRRTPLQDDRGGAFPITSHAFSLEKCMSTSLHHLDAARARALISDPEHWLQGELAMTDDSHSVDPTNMRADRFCAVAALRRAAHELVPRHHDLADRVQNALEQMVHLRHPHLSDCLENLNDDGDHHTVLRLFDEFLAAEMA